MLKIKIGSTWLETKGLEIPVTLKSPLPFRGKRVAGSYIFNISIPYTAALKKEVGYIHRPSSNNPRPGKLQFYLEQGPIKYAGECTLKDVGNNTAEVSALINTGVLAALLKETNMSDVDMGGARVEPDTLRTIAATSADREFNHQDAVYFTKEGFLAFANITSNAGNELSVDGLSFTTLTANVFLWEYNLNLEVIRGTFAIRFFVNSVMVQESPLISGVNIGVYSMPLQAGDVVTISMFMKSEGSYPSLALILGTLFAGSGIKVYRQSAALNFGANNMFPNSDYAVFPLHNPKLLDGLPDDMYALDQHSIKEVYEQFFPIVNYYKDGIFPVTMEGIANEESFSAFNLFVPFPYLAYFISRMAKHLGFTIGENSFVGSNLKQLVIYNAFAENEYLSSNLVNIIDGFDLANHVPDEKLSDFLSDVCALLGIAFDCDSFRKTIRFKSLAGIVNSRSFTTFPGIITEPLALSVEPYKGYKLTQEVGPDSFAKDRFKPIDELIYQGEIQFVYQLALMPSAINYCYYVTSVRQYYIYNYDEELGLLNWIFYSNEFRHTTENINQALDGDIFEIKTKWAACMNNEAKDKRDAQLSGNDERLWTIPYTEEPGAFESIPPQFAGKYSKYLLFYRGLQKGHPGNFLYPMGSHDVYDHFSNKITGADLSLRWDGEYGLWEKRHKAWVEWAINQPGKFTTKAYLTPLQLSKLDFFKWYRINSHDFLIAEIRFNITETDVSQVEIDLYRR